MDNIVVPVFWLTVYMPLQRLLSDRWTKSELSTLQDAYTFNEMHKILDKSDKIFRTSR